MDAWIRLLPEAILSFGGTLVLIICAFGPERAMRDFLRWLSLFTVLGAAVAVAGLRTQFSQPADLWTVTSPLSTAFGMVLLSLVAWTILAGRAPADAGGEWFALLMFVALACLTLSRVANLAGLFLGIEILSLSLYVLIAFLYDRRAALRGGAMYLALAGYASAFLVFGMALVYAVYGTMQINELQTLVTTAPMKPLAVVGFAIFLVGIGFKLAVVPFHMWAADVYEAAPGAVAGAIASVSKGATLAAFIPFMFLLNTHEWVVIVLAGASMIIGNLLGLRETRVKRILAYSSIAHIGYILLGWLAGQEATQFGQAIDGRTAILYYIAAYGLSVLGAFVTLAAMRPDGAITLNDLHGAARRHPMLAACMLVFVASLAGLPIPITAGFWGKLYLFSAAFHAHYVKLAVLGLIGSAIGIFYYLRILVHLFMVAPETGERGPAPEYSALQHGVLILSAIAVVLIGCLPDAMLRVLRF
jgi:NADH-quinone oxidoreductase subunit N